MLSTKEEIKEFIRFCVGCRFILLKLSGGDQEAKVLREGNREAGEARKLIAESPSD